MKKNLEQVDLNRYIILRIDGNESCTKVQFRVDPILKYRDFLTMANDRGIVSNHHGIKMKWSCVLNEHPDTSIVMSLPPLPKDLRGKIVVDSRIDTVGTDYMAAVYYSPVFKTKEKDVYAFHESIVFVLDVEGWRNDVVIRKFIRFKIVDGTVEWLDCCGDSNYPFGLGPDD